jgi:WD40 repeat protein/serine/threonine protein kinase
MAGCALMACAANCKKWLHKGPEMNDTPFTHSCIMCGEAFHPASPEIAICPKCEGPPEAIPEQRVGKAIQLDVGVSNQHLEVPVQPHREEAAAQEDEMDASQVPLEWQEGDVILDLYEVQGELGRGGMGVVYKVRHRGWDMELAVKSPLQSALDQVGGEGKFIAEAEAWIDLGLHPNIATCYYVRKLGPVPRLFAEYVQGGSLSQWIAKGNLQDLESVLDGAIQFAWGLDYAHQQKLTHKDVKPDNVLITTDGVVKVTDFGQAKAKAGYTPAYCSPEQAAAQFDSSIKLTPATDMWSWALSILEVFAGSHFWVNPAMPLHAWGQVAPQALQAYLAGEVDQPAIGHMPGSLSELLAGCFREDPEERSEGMGVVAERLVEIYEGEIGRPYPREQPQAADLKADSLNNQALSFLDLEKEQKATQAWELSLEEDPQHPEATYNQGLVLWRQGKITDDQLVQQMESVLVSHPGDWLPLYLLALVHLERDDCQAAIDNLEQIGRSDAQRDEVAKMLSAAHKRQPDSRRLLRIFEGHTDAIHSVQFSIDGRLAISAGNDKIVRVWDLTTGDCWQTLEGHEGDILSVSLSADNRYAISGSLDYELRLWEVKRGRCLKNFIGENDFFNVKAVSLSSDGRFAISAADVYKTLRLWELSSGSSRELSGHSRPVSTVCLSANNHYALSGSKDKELRLWKVALDEVVEPWQQWFRNTGQCVRTFKGHAGGVESVSLSTDGSLALSGSQDKTLKLWEVATGRCLRTFKGHKSGVHSVDLSLDARCALSSSGEMRLWDVESGRCLRTFLEDTGWINEVSLNADGSLALSAGVDTKVRLWQLKTGRRPFKAPYRFCIVLASESASKRDTTFKKALAGAREYLKRGNIPEVARTIRSARAIPGYDKAPQALEAWHELYLHLPRADFSSGWELATLEGHTDEVSSLDLDSNGRLALSGSEDGTIKLWDLEQGLILRTFEGISGGVASVCLSTDNRTILAGGGSNWNPDLTRSLKSWDVSSGSCLKEFAYQGLVWSVCMSADGRFALSGNGDKTLMLWDMNDGRFLRIFRGHTGDVYDVSLSEDERYALSGSQDKELKLWEVSTGRCLRTFKGHEGGVRSVCLSADGHHALSGGKELLLWEVTTGRCLQTFMGHEDRVLSVCLSADGHYALSGSSDETVKLWELSTGSCLHTFEGHKHGVEAVSLSFDGRYAISGSRDNTIKLWALDWELQDNEPADWDEGARPYLETFLTLHTPYATELPQGRDPTEEEVRLALTRQGIPVWTEEDFHQLLYKLGCAGYGWLRPEGVRCKLQEMAAERT